MKAVLYIHIHQHIKPYGYFRMLATYFWRIASTIGFNTLLWNTIDRQLKKINNTTLPEVWHGVHQYFTEGWGELLPFFSAILNNIVCKVEQDQATVWFGCNIFKKNSRHQSFHLKLLKLLKTSKRNNLMFNSYGKESAITDDYSKIKDLLLNFDVNKQMFWKDATLQSRNIKPLTFLNVIVP